MFILKGTHWQNQLIVDLQQSYTYLLSCKFYCGKLLPGKFTGLQAYILRKKKFLRINNYSSYKEFLRLSRHMNSSIWTSAQVNMTLQQLKSNSLVRSNFHWILSGLVSKLTSIVSTPVNWWKHAYFHSCHSSPQQGVSAFQTELSNTRNKCFRYPNQ